VEPDRATKNCSREGVKGQGQKFHQGKDQSAVTYLVSSALTGKISTQVEVRVHISV